MKAPQWRFVPDHVMDLKALHTFVHVARLGSFTAFARAENLDPSLVSRSISGLEHELGITLFHRSTRRLALTEAGMAYLEQIEPLVAQLESATEELRSFGKVAKGVLRISTSIAFGLRVLSPHLQTFCSSYPGVQVRVSLSDHNADLVAERLDLAIRVGVKPDPAAGVEALVPIRHAICAAPAYLQRRGRPERVEELARHDTLNYGLPSHGKRWKWRDPTGAIASVQVSGPVTSTSGLLLRDFALGGRGIALLPDWLVSEDLTQGTLVDLFPGIDCTSSAFDVSVCLVRRPNQQMLPHVRLFSSFLKRCLAGSPAVRE